MKLLLSGGGSKEKTIEVNKIFDEIIDNSKPLLYIPLAREDEKTFNNCYEWIKEEMKDVRVNDIEMVSSFEELIDKDFNSYCALFIGGGNTFKLLEGLKRTNTLKKIDEYVKNGGIVYGGSAGAVIFGKDINSVTSTDKNFINIQDTSGLNMLDGKSIFCHYTNKNRNLSEEENYIREEQITETLIDFSKNNGEVIAIPEEDTIYIDDDNISIIGTKNYYTFKDGERFEHELT